MKAFLLLIILCVSFGRNSDAQERVRINDDEFFSKNEGALKAREYLKNADKLYKKGKYREALVWYEKLHDYNSESSALNYKMGLCYFFTSNKNTALEYFLSRL